MSTEDYDRRFTLPAESSLARQVRAADLSAITDFGKTTRERSITTHNSGLARQILSIPVLVFHFYR
jgi:hypothetical protein